MSIGLRVLNSTPFQHNDTQQVSVSWALLVKKQVCLQDKPTPVVGVISFFLRGHLRYIKSNKKIVFAHEKWFHIVYDVYHLKPFCWDIPLYPLEMCTRGNGLKSSHEASSQHLKKRQRWCIRMIFIPKSALDVTNTWRKSDTAKYAWPLNYCTCFMCVKAKWICWYDTKHPWNLKSKGRCSRKQM